MINGRLLELLEKGFELLELGVVHVLGVGELGSIQNMVPLPRSIHKVNIKGTTIGAVNVGTVDPRRVVVDGGQAVALQKARKPLHKVALEDALGPMHKAAVALEQPTLFAVADPEPRVAAAYRVQELWGTVVFPEELQLELLVFLAELDDFPFVKHVRDQGQPRKLLGGCGCLWLISGLL